MLDLEKEDLEKLSEEDKVIKKYMSEVERINEDPEIYEYMSAEEDNRKIENTMREYWKEEGLRDGREEGIKEGIKENIKENSINLYKNGVSKDIIIKSLNITEELLDDYLKEIEQS